MKALEVLNKYKSEQKFLLNCMKQSLPHRDIKIINNDIQLCDEAIEELEAIQDIILEKEESMDIERFMFKNKIEELNNRSCESCNQWNDSCINLSINTTGFCMYYGICNGDFEEDMKNSFCCNRYEKKDSK